MRYHRYIVLMCEDIPYEGPWLYRREIEARSVGEAMEIARALGDRDQEVIAAFHALGEQWFDPERWFLIKEQR